MELVVFAMSNVTLDKEIVHVFWMGDLLFCLLFVTEYYYYPFIYLLLHYLIDF